MIERTRDAMLLHAMLLHPEVAPNMTWSYDDLERNLADDRHVALIDGVAGAVFEWSAPCVYEGHFLFLPPVRGRLAIERGKAMIAEMMGRYSARMVWGRVLLANRAARWMARQIGLRSLGVERGHELFAVEA
jgi:hypothetical protein